MRLGHITNMALMEIGKPLYMGGAQQDDDLPTVVDDLAALQEHVK